MEAREGGLADPQRSVKSKRSGGEGRGTPGSLQCILLYPHPCSMLVNFRVNVCDECRFNGSDAKPFHTVDRSADTDLPLNKDPFEEYHSPARFVPRWLALPTGVLMRVNNSSS